MSARDAPRPRVHVVHAHSEADSFVTAMKNVIVAEFRDTGHQVTVSDLHAKNFNPVASPRDFLERSDASRLVYPLEQRHGYATGTLAADIHEEIEPVLAADLLVFTFPVYWFGAPAILKGWFDRVLLSGVCYGGKRVYGRGGLAGKRAFSAFSLGAKEGMFGADGIHGELVTGMMRHLFQGTMGYVGLDVVQPFGGYNVPYIAQDKREGLLDELRAVVRNLDDRPVLAVPDLDDFSEKLLPLHENPAVS
ncbi:NAD(P)H-dependent oxidoreductase [Novosphingobium sp. BL-52-GroH]|uniref:NAD(P)H-dependent oxidoreductase n=1 Tax=Novosphingobium sp. BL-52-GroH TaxID=3349877 RepID=UPI00384F5430